MRSSAYPLPPAAARLPVAGFVLLLMLLACTIALQVSPRTAALALPSSSLNRPADPVVLTGASVPTLNGIAPTGLIAFRYSGAWQQIPVQVDERAVLDYGVVYHNGAAGVTALNYTDPNTWAGPDPDPNLDANDEIAFMARDSGGPATGPEPPGVVSGSGVDLTISDPLDPTATGYIYLFSKSGNQDPGAGQDYVSYTFTLLAGNPYTQTYHTLAGPNPENSVITTTFYSHRFSDRWADVALNVLAPGSSGADILDRHKTLFSPSDCTRSEDTFNAGEGAFFVNKDGPVRAIRSYMGANSGPITQRTHIFYDRRQDLTTNMRVHAIPGIMDFFDYSPQAAGMTYYDDLNPTGVPIDGSPDTVTRGAVHWEMVTGPQGSVTQAHAVSSDIPALTYTLYYLDSTTPPDIQCTGDAFAYGSSGPWVNQALPCTDPSMGCSNYLNTTRYLYYDPPGMTVAGAAARYNQAANPLTFTAQAWSPAATPTNTPTFTPTSTPTPVLVVHVTWHGIPQPNSRNTTETITMTLRPIAGGPPTEYSGYTTDAGGSATFSVGALAPGDYSVRVKGPRNLATCGVVTLTGAPVIGVEMGLQGAGDTDNSNNVSAPDFVVLRAAFGKQFGEPGYDSRADFDNTDLVSSIDFSLLKANFGFAGCR
ncbi:MAG: hypothetical protein ACJ78Q_18625 [Chloroflexia bacterium]